MFGDLICPGFFSSSTGVHPGLLTDVPPGLLKEWIPDNQEENSMASA